MTVTANGKMVEVDWMWLFDYTGELMMGYKDDRPMVEIAADWEGVPLFERRSEEEGDINYEGFTRIRRIVKDDIHKPGTVEIVFVKGAANE